MSGGGVRAVEYGLLGRTLKHSYSPEIHGMLGDYRYELIEAEPDAAADFLCGRAFRGLNVTIPYKQLAFSLCDELSETARATGAVNTILNRDGRLIGHNTDYSGFLSMLRRSGVGFDGRKAAVLGGGGSGKMALAALASIGAKPVLISRAGPVDYAALYRSHADVELLINTTPVGMYPQNGAAPVAIERLGQLKAVYDLIYNPYRTELMLDAEEKRIPAHNGLWMLIAQAKAAAELFTGAPIGEEAIGHIHGKLRRAAENIVLIGMPGCGKSSIGRALAERMNRPFVDLDEELVRREGISIPEVFASRGEGYFRERESALIAEYGREKSLVIATGGGAVLRRRNMRALRQNGEIAFIDRAVDELAMDGRPLSADRAAIERMAAARLPLYRKYSSLTVCNARGIVDAARAVEEGYNEIAGD